VRRWTDQARHRRARHLDCLAAIGVGTGHFRLVAHFAQLPVPGRNQPGGAACFGGSGGFCPVLQEGHNGTLPSPALVKAALINTAYDLDDSFGTLPIPNGDEGWGSIDLTPFFDPGLNFTFIDQGLVLTNEQVFEHHLILGGNDEPLKIHLAYTDPPGLPAAIPALVNDLDLEVLAPNGEIYRGNQMENGVSLPNPLGRDSRNNVEGVILRNPTPGEYIVRVRGRSVVADIHGEPDEPGQDFALVISGQASAPGIGNVSLDRAAYRAPGLIRITLVDTDLAGQPSVNVQVQSTLETVAEAVLLMASGSHGSFTGSIATATGPAIADGKLQIAHNNTIQVVYFDASANVNRTATARGDLLPPVLSNPSVTNAFGETTIFWTTDEPANSIVRLGTNNVISSLNLAVTNNALGLSHVIDIGGLDVGATYYYYCVSSDEAGNTATNSNNGSLFSFVVPTNAPILLIDEYQDTLFGAPPITGYTAALGAIGPVMNSGTPGSAARRRLTICAPIASSSGESKR
jgi:hypothetical protein